MPVECAPPSPLPKAAATQLVFNGGDLEALRSAWGNMMAAWTHTFDSMHYWAAFPFTVEQLRVIVHRLHEAGFICLCQYTRRPVDEMYRGDYENGFYVFFDRRNQPLVRSYQVNVHWFDEDRAAVRDLQQKVAQSKASGDRTFCVDFAHHPFTDGQKQAIALQMLRAGFVLVNLGGDPVDLDTPYHYINGFTIVFKVRKLDLQ